MNSKTAITKEHPECQTGVARGLVPAICAPLICWILRIRWGQERLRDLTIMQIWHEQQHNRMLSYWPLESTLDSRKKALNCLEKLLENFLIHLMSSIGPGRTPSQLRWRSAAGADADAKPTVQRSRPSRQSSNAMRCIHAQSCLRTHGLSDCQMHGFSSKPD
jgi:hypothetical protein